MMLEEPNGKRIFVFLFVLIVALLVVFGVYRYTSDNGQIVPEAPLSAQSLEDIIKSLSGDDSVKSTPVSESVIKSMTVSPTKKSAEDISAVMKALSAPSN